MYAPIVRRVDDSRAAGGPHVTEREPSGLGAGRGRQIGMLPTAAGERQLVNGAVDAAEDDGGNPIAPDVPHQNTLVEGLRGARGLGQGGRPPSAVAQGQLVNELVLGDVDHRGDPVRSDEASGPPQEERAGALTILERSVSVQRPFGGSASSMSAIVPT